MSAEARLADLQSELARVREAIEAAGDASRLSVDGRSLTRQSLAALESREAHLTWAISAISNGSPFGPVIYAQVGNGHQTL